MSASQSQLNYTQTMYIAYYGRAADPGGLAFWAGRLAEEGPAGIANAFGNSAEFTANYGSLTNEELVNGLFLQLFGRAADPEGLAFYTNWLDTGFATLPDIALRIIDGVNAGSGDDLIVANRVEVANVVTNLASQTPLRDTILDAVNGDQRSVDTAIESLGVSLEDRERFNLSVDESDGKVGIDSSALLSPLTAESGDILGLDVLRADPRFTDIDGSGYTVVVLDTGIDLNHPAFGPDNDGNGVSDRIVYHQDFSNDGDGTADDVNGHGSNVSSIIGSSSAAFEGVAPGVNIVALQVLGNDGGGSFDGIQRALQWVVDNHAAFNIVAVNLSLGTSTNSNTPEIDVLADEFAALNTLGIINIAAAGNDYFSFQAPGVGYPASDPNVIAVGATFDANVGSQAWADGAEAFSTAVDVIVPFSQRSPTLTPIFAPGATITGAAPGGGTEGQTGTSQAAPQIAGVAALAQQIADQELGRRLTPAEFLSLISSTAVSIVDGDDENDNVFNSGATFERVNVPALANAIANLDGGDTPPPAPAEDAIPGDTSTQAMLTLGVITEGVIDTRGDRDWYRVDLDAGQNYDFSLNGITLADPWLGLFDPTGVAIAANNDSGGTSNSALSFTPTVSGTYFLSAEGFTEIQTGTYVIEAQISPVANNDLIPGDSSSTETLIVNDFRSSSIDFGGDQDWLRMTLEAGVTYTINVTGSTSGGGDLNDPVLEVFSSTSQAVAFNNDGGAGLEASLVFTPDSDGTYFAAVRAFGAEETGSYTITLQSDDTTDSVPGDSSTDATLANDATVNSSIDFAGDEDWFAVTLTAGTQYVFELQGSDPDALADPFLALFDDGSDIPLAEDDDSGSGLNSRLAFTPDSSGTFFISASAFGSGIGDYTLSLGAGSAGSTDAINGVDIGDAGNSSATASAVTLDDGEADANGSAGFGDDGADFYSFTAPASGLANFSLTGLGADLDIALEDASGQVIAGSFEAAASDESFSVTVEQGESYVLRVDPFGSAASAYQLNFDLPASSVDGREESINGIDTGDAAETLEEAALLPASGFIEVLGSAGFGTDAWDVFAFTAAGDGSASFNLSELRSDLDLALLSASGAILASSSFSGNVAESFDFPVLADEDYFVWVLPFTGASEYKLEIQLPSGSGGASDAVNGVDIGDAGADPSSATDIALDPQGDALIAGSAGFGGDEGDFYRFTAAATGFAAFELIGLTDDLDLELFSADGTSLAYFPAYDSDPEYIAGELTGGQSYIVGVYPWDTAESDYTLLINTEASSASSDIVNGDDIGDAGSYLEPTPVEADASGKIFVTGSAGFGNDESDAFSFTAVSSDQPSFGNEVTIALTDIADDADLDLYIYDADGEVLAQSTNSGSEDEMLQFVFIAGEEYAVEVYAYDGASTYTLDLQGLDVEGGSDSVEGIDVGDAPDNTIDTLDITGVLSPLGVILIEGYVGFGDDSGDYYVIDALADGAINLSLFDLEADIDLYLRDSIGNVLAASTFSGDESEFITFSALEGERFLLHVDPYNDAESEYGLLVNFPPPPISSEMDRINGIPVGDAGGEDDNPTLAIPETIDSSITIEGTVGKDDDDSDNYSVIAPGSGEVSISYEVSAPVDVLIYDFFDNILIDTVLPANETGSLNFDVSIGVLYTLKLEAEAETEYYLEVSAPELLASPGDDIVVGNPQLQGDAGDSIEATWPLFLSESGDGVVIGSTGVEDDDADFFVMSPEVGGVASVNLTGLVGDLDLAVFDVLGTPIALSDNSGTDEESVTFDTVAETLYIVAVTPYEDAESSYNLILDFPPTASSDSGEFVNGLSAGDAGGFLEPLAVVADGFGDIRISGYADPATDAFDAFVFVAPATDTLFVDLYNFAAAADLDVSLYDFDGNQLAASTSDVDGEAEALAYDVIAGEQYIVEVAAYEGVGTSYFLDLVV